jgi:protoheme IX farnesyltransferase
MKAAAQILDGVGAVEKTWFAVYADLVKARLTTLVLLTTLVGFCLGSRGPLNYALLLHALLGTALLAGGAAALNQLLEREHDAKMRRTRDRPLPSGRLQPMTVMVFGAVASGAGLIHLVLFVNLLTGILGALTFTCYLFVYTPLKRVTWLNTVVGALPGAMPPLMGWAAARGELGVGGWALFAIQAFWQMPHFYAIAWLYRDEYAGAGFRMLPGVDPTGRRTAGQAVGCVLGLVAASLCPFLFDLAGPVYLAGAVLLVGIFLGFALRFARVRTPQRARQLFYSSLIYLPLLFVLLAFDKVR